MSAYLTLLLAIALGWDKTTSELSTIVQTPLGIVRGRIMTSRGGRHFLAFSGIPYAKPPVGELRFEAPERLESWSGVRNATEDGPYCVQYNVFLDNPTPTGVEDCLYLSLYTHNVKRREAVLVHFHGGNFVAGNGARETGPQYLMDENIVVVDVNYRLGMFGFLSFEDKHMPGNQGMKDQVMALHWIQQNIASFGGDPKRVTLIGESAGAGSVYHHTVSPLSKGLFHSGIAESGSSYNPWSVSVPGVARNASLYLLSMMGCSYTRTKEAVACLKSKDAYEIVSKTENYRSTSVDFTYLFIPVLEPPTPGAFLTGPISNWNHNPVPLLMGTTSAEALIRTLFLPYSLEYLSDNFDRIALESLQIENSASNPKEVIKAVRDFYFAGQNITSRDWVNVTNMYSDSLFTAGILDGAYNHSGKVYLYLFDYLGDISFAGNIESRNTSLVFGAMHIDEIIYIWYQKDYAPLKGNDLELSKKLLRMWADFARYGNPTPSLKGYHFHWNECSLRHPSFFHISNSDFKIEKNLAGDRYKFWKSQNYRDNFDRFYEERFQ